MLDVINTGKNQNSEMGGDTLTLEKLNLDLDSLIFVLKTRFFFHIFFNFFLKHLASFPKLRKFIPV
jgi:hypothetical protein